MFLSPSPYEIQQRKQTQAFLIWVVMAAAFLLCAWDFQFRTWFSVISSFCLGLCCIPLLIINQQGHFFLSAATLSVAILVTIFFNLYDGHGVYDFGMLAYPIFILVGTLMFGRRAAPICVLATIASVAGVVALQVTGRIHSSVGKVEWSVLIPIITLFTVAGAVIWVIVRNLERNLQRVKESQAELEKNYDRTLEAWAIVLETRDRETEGHSRRLADLTSRLAQALGLSEAESVQLRRGALIHDIGKLAIPDQILLKPGPLDATEREIIRKHPVYAKNMLDGIKFLEPSLCVAYSHHEWWDGNGYPEGLKGDQIPLLARIFSVVDTWDALGSERSYRPAWSREEIVKYIRENAGRIFDPQIVEVFLKLV
jgi:putative nucleotidyltransferase with HDIG domain